MPEILRRILEGVSFIRLGGMQREYPTYRGFEADYQSLAGDWRNNGNNMRAVLKRESSKPDAEMQPTCQSIESLDQCN